MDRWLDADTQIAVVVAKTLLIYMEEALEETLLQKSGDERLLASPHAEARIHLSLQGPQLARVQPGARGPRPIDPLAR